MRGMSSRPPLALQQLIYLSQASPELGPTDVRAILGSAQVANRRRDVTGFLLYSGRHFIQVLEGRADELDPLVRRIGSDPRHLGLQVVSRVPIQRRRYGTWAMGYLESLDSADELHGLFEAGGASATAVWRLLEGAGAAL